MNNKKIKVAMVTNHFGITGIGTVIMNYCKALDNQYQKNMKRNAWRTISI